MNTNGKIKIGILGCGAVAYRWYLKGLCNKNPKYEVVVVCDIDGEKSRKAANEFNVKFCESKEQMLEHNIDLAVVLTRHQDHFEQIKFFLNNNINVYSEKPFAPNYIQGMELIALAKSKNLKFGSAPQIMFSSRNIKTKQLINDGCIGKLTMVRASCSNLGPAGRSDTDYDPEWFYNEGGSLASLGIYGLSTLVWIMGRPKRLSCFEGISFGEREVMFGPAMGKKFKVTAPDNVVAMMDFGEATYAMFDGSYVVANPPKYEFEIHGTKGSLLVGGFGGPASIIFCSLKKECKEIGPDDDCHLKWNLAWAVEDLALSVLENREPRASAEFALQIIEIMELMKKSAKGNISVQL